MALIDKASLLMVPSVYEDGTLYNVLPSGNKAPDETGNANGYDQTRADFSFTRGANLAATRVNASGLIEKGRENLLLQSNQFDTTWANISSSETSGQEGYDGTNNAWLLTKSGTNGRIQQSITGTGVYTFSIYAKAGTNNWCTLIADFVSGTDVIVWFDLQNGIVGTESGSPIESKISSVGNGWYRISISFTCPASLQTLRVYVADGDNDNSGTSGSIYIQDAQLEAGLVATDYIETGSTTATAGVLENTPRIDYSSGAGALLLEPQRTNLVTNSEYHSGTTYGNNDVTTTDNEAISPEGLQNAAKIVLDSGTNTSNGGHYYSLNSTAGTTYTISVFAKAGEYRYFTFTYGSSTAVGGHFDLQEGVKLGDITNSSYTNTSSSIEDYGNGWYRLIVTLTDTNGAPARFLSMKPSPSASVPSNNNYSSTGDGTSGAYIYGFQLEAASHVSSYVPTYGSAATRGADYMNTTPTDLLGSTTGSWFMEMNDMTFEVTGTSVPTIYLGDDVSNCLALEGRNSGNNKSVFLVKEEGGTVTTLHAFTISGKTKFCFVWSGTTLKVFRDGTEEYSSTSFTQPTNWDLFVYNHTGREAFSEIANIQLYDTALSDSEAQTLTTL